MNDALKFINYINDHYNELFSRFQAFCNDKRYAFDPDIFQDTILKCYTLIDKQGYLKDTTDKGIENYFFMSFKQNLQREKQYARCAKRDNNILNVDATYEEFSNRTKITVNDKLLNDLFKDYATLYMMRKVEDNFDSEHFYLFRFKTFTNMTYAQLSQKTGIKGVRQKVIAVKNWLKQNVTKEEVKKAFESEYGNLLL